ncbi:MAG: Fmu (Sun) domain-containing protein [Ferruginibacter sp.]
MGRYYNHLISAEKIITQNDGKQPLLHVLKKYFAANKKHGSKDRRQISALCYAYYRAALALKAGDLQQKIIQAFFITEKYKNAALEELAPELNEAVEKPLAKKMERCGISIYDIFPFKQLLGEQVDADAFYTSFLQQPHLFLRSRPGRQELVVQKLQQHDIDFRKLDDDSFVLKNASKLDAVLQLNKEAVVQDHSSQQVLNYLKTYKANEKISAWDACAASGGKSILLFDLLKGNVKISVSDIRPSMLQNLSERLKEAGVNIYRKFTADLTKPTTEPGDEKFDIILCDAPCSGSGTWARTPEQLFFFNQKSIGSFTERQQKIVTNTLPFLQENGLFFYITCSVFKKENEEMAAWISLQHKLPLLQQKYIAGYGRGADTMFVAVFGGEGQ